MEALIIAAGTGSRLREISDSKPLTPIAGIPLLEIGIRQAARAGAKRVVVVTGYRAEAIEAVMPRFSRNADVPVIAHRIENWLRPNGYSVMAGASLIDGEYLLMMADHIFAPPILNDLVRQGRADRGITLAIDRRIDGPLLDPEDATWVRTERDGSIRAIGKAIRDFDAVDCGAFLATPELAAAIAASIAAGRPGSLSDGVQLLADRGRARTMDIGASWWLDVDDPRAYALAELEAAARLSEIYGAGVGAHLAYQREGEDAVAGSPIPPNTVIGSHR